MPDLRHGWRVHGRAQRLPGKIAVYYTAHILRIVESVIPGGTRMPSTEGASAKGPR